MTLRHLRIFVAVCRHGSITRAAQALHMAQPSLSLAIKELEEYYQLHLFDRIARKLYLTQEGEHFLRYATHIISMFDEMEEKLLHQRETETLRIGSSVTIANSLLCGCLQEFQSNFPQRKAQILIENSSILEEKILTSELDLALTEGLPNHPQVQKEIFFHDELALICANEHPFAQKGFCTLPQLLQEHLLFREKGSGTREILDSILRSHNCSVHPLWESASTRALVQGVQYNFGLSILPYQMIKESILQHAVTRLQLQDVSLRRDYYIIYHINKYQNAAMKDFMQICRSRLHEHTHV